MAIGQSAYIGGKVRIRTQAMIGGFVSGLRFSATQSRARA